MKGDRYEFVYSTKTKKNKRIAYFAESYAAALRRFGRNVRRVGPFGIWLNCAGFGIWLGEHGRDPAPGENGPNPPA